MFEHVQTAVEFVVAFGSLLGWFIVVLSVVGMFFASAKLRTKLLWYLIMGAILILVCGPDTGFKYFFIH